MKFTIGKEEITIPQNEETWVEDATGTDVVILFNRKFDLDYRVVGDGTQPFRDLSMDRFQFVTKFTRKDLVGK
jgi:hypothetical protein